MATSANATIEPLILEGTAYQRGLAHGETLRAKIQELVRGWQAEVSAGFGLDAAQVIQRFVGRTNFLSAIQAAYVYREALKQAENPHSRVELFQQPITT